jgi:hypothetical protein
MKNPGDLDPNATYQKLPDVGKPLQLFVSPSQYIQGQGVIGLLGDYLSLCVSALVAGVIIHRAGRSGDASSTEPKAAGFTVEKTLFQVNRRWEAERPRPFFRTRPEVAPHRHRRRQTAPHGKGCGVETGVPGCHDPYHGLDRGARSGHIPSSYDDNGFAA